MKARIKSFHGVAVWKWGFDDDVCGICRMPLEACCPEVKFPGDDCPPQKGKCGHVFHMQCIMKWIEKNIANEICPMCRQPWQLPE